MTALTVLLRLPAIALALRLHAAYPTVPIERCVAGAAAAIAAARPGVTAELLAAIAEHESDLRPDVVSWRVGGQRVDAVWVQASNSLEPLMAPNSALRSAAIGNARSRWPARSVCGYLAASLDRAGCVAAIADDGGMALGAEQIEAWILACHGDQRCGLAGYAGGWAGARAARDRRVTDATRFADLFLARARRLSSSARPLHARWTPRSRVVSISTPQWD